MLNHHFPNQHYSMLFAYYIFILLIELRVWMSLFLLWKLWPPPSPIPNLSTQKKANSKIHNLYSTQMHADKHMSEIIPLTTFQSIPTVYCNWNKNNCVKCHWMWHLPCLTATLHSQKLYVMKEVLWLEAFNCKLSQL